MLNVVSAQAISGVVNFSFCLPFEPCSRAAASKKIVCNRITKASSRFTFYDVECRHSRAYLGWLILKKHLFYFDVIGAATPHCTVYMCASFDFRLDFFAKVLCESETRVPEKEVGRVIESKKEKRGKKIVN